MTTDGIAAETLVIGSAAGTAYYVTDGTIVASVETRDGSRVELRMSGEVARRLAVQLQEQARLLETYRADTGLPEGAEDGPAGTDLISSLTGEPQENA